MSIASVTSSSATQAAWIGKSDYAGSAGAAGQALGPDPTNANDKLSRFLQTLADKLPGAGASGNLVNTTV